MAFTTGFTLRVRGKGAVRAAQRKERVGELDHIALACKDVDGMVRFYSGLLGFPTVNLEKFKEGAVPFPSVRINQGSIIDFFPLEDATASFRQVSHFCIRMEEEDYVSVKEVLSENGYEPTRKESKLSGARGTGIAQYYKDPEDNTVELRFYESAVFLDGIEP
eukprot:CAMPEP_0184749832 /NCGR_PEP_ID=MMETSP0315-20130426/31270_1 /TAXON_ID=101924 /ORGANISM="Rhodosorus marinus, Strain UTEX LB 2760" /LENGTH=162 /DNA_ID=CAMNT_0027227291 /DNA_START=106 /DNA_END=589 /DNA_ORIENTATION=+